MNTKFLDGVKVEFMVDFIMQEKDVIVCQRLVAYGNEAYWWGFVDHDLYSKSTSRQELLEAFWESMKTAHSSGKLPDESFHQIEVMLFGDQNLNEEQIDTEE